MSASDVGRGCAGAIGALVILLGPGVAIVGIWGWGGVGVGYLWTEVVSLTRPRTVTLFALIFCLGHRLSSKFTLWCQPQPWLTALAVPTKLLDSGE